MRYSAEETAQRSTRKTPEIKISAVVKLSNFYRISRFVQFKTRNINKLTAATNHKQASPRCHSTDTTSTGTTRQLTGTTTQLVSTTHNDTIDVGTSCSGRVLLDRKQTHVTYTPRATKMRQSILDSLSNLNSFKKLF